LGEWREGIAPLWEEEWEDLSSEDRMCHSTL